MTPDTGPAERPPRTMWSGLLVVVCLLSVAAVTFTPYSSRLNRLTVRLFMFFRTDVPIAPVWVTPEDYGNLLNVALFVPVGMLLAWWLRSLWGWALPLSICLSVVIELVQRLPELARESSLADVACNALGACVGVVVVAAVRAAVAPAWQRDAGPTGAKRRESMGRQ